MVSGYEVVPGDVLKLLVEDGLQQIKQLINTMYKSGECPKDCIKLQCLS
jgi:hypothetical protein